MAVSEILDENLLKVHKLKEGDIILKINEIAIDSIFNFYSEILKYRENDECVTMLIRNGKHKTIKGNFAGKPKESSENHDIIYDEVAFMDGYLRVIIDKPQSDKPMPAIYFIQGYTCGSLDNVNPLYPNERFSNYEFKIHFCSMGWFCFWFLFLTPFQVSLPEILF